MLDIWWYVNEASRAKIYWFVSFILVFRILLALRSTKLGNWEMVMLVPYLVVLFGFTVFSRSYWPDAEVRMELFASWSKALSGKTDVFGYIIINIIIFIPIGFLLIRTLECIIYRNATLVSAFLSFGVTLLIEILQLVSCRGYFEIDDIIHNTMGAIIGMIVGKISKHV